MKKLILLFVLLSTSILWSKIPVPTFTNNAINDYANLIDATTEAQLNRMLLAHKDSTTVEIVVLTYTDIENETIDEFANRVFNTWRVGNKKTNNGAMFILTLKPNRKYRTEVGGGLEGILTDALTKRYAEKIFKPKAQAGDVSGGVLDLITAYIKETSPEYVALKKEEEKLAAIKRAQDREAFNATMISIGIVLLYILGLAIVIGGPIFIIYTFLRRAELRKEAREKARFNVLAYLVSIEKKLAAAVKIGIPNAQEVLEQLLLSYKNFTKENPPGGKNEIDEQKHIDVINRVTKSVISHYDLYERVWNESLKTSSSDFKELYERIQLARKRLETLSSENIFNKKDLSTDFNKKASNLESKLESSRGLFKNSTSITSLEASYEEFKEINDDYTWLLFWVESIITKADKYIEAKRWVEKNTKRVEKYANENSSHVKVAKKFEEVQKMQKAQVVDYIGLATAMGFLLNIIPQERRQAEELDRARRDRERRRREEENSRRYSSSSSYGSSSSGGGFSCGGGSSFGGGSSGNW
jgi:uncharacterized protein